MNTNSAISLANQVRKSPFAFLVNNPRITILLILGSLFTGISSIRSMPVESAPEIKIPIGTVLTIFPGASPEDIETLVTNEIEKEIKNLDNLSKVTSTSRDGVSSIVVEFTANANIEESITDLKDAVDLAQTRLPDSANDSIVEQVRLEDEPIVQFLLVGEVPLLDLKVHADALEDILEGITGVSEVDISGLPDREMQIFVDKEKIDALQIPITQVEQVIAQNHLDIPVGTLLLNNTTYQTSLKGKFTTASELQTIAITERNGSTITLGDIAEVREGFAENRRIAKVYDANTDSVQSAIALDVRKKQGADLVKIVRTAESITADYAADLGDESIRILNTNNTADQIATDINNLISSAIQTVLIIGVTLFLALGFRESILAAISVPLLYLMSFVGLSYFDSTFNFLTFFALILSLGIVVDTSIVIVEGIYEGMENDGVDAKTAALASIQTFKAPLISGSLTTIAAFLPLGLMSGIFGQYVRYIPITINVTLVASLFVALVVLPSIATWILKKDTSKKPHKKPILFRFFEPLEHRYGQFIETVLLSPRLQKLWLIGIGIAFVISIVFVITGILPFQLFSSGDSEYFTVRIEAPEGTDVLTTEELGKEVEAIVQNIAELRSYTAIYGAEAPYIGTLAIRLTPQGDRTQKSTEISDNLRKSTADITAVDVQIQEQESGPPSGADIQVRLQSANTQDLQAATETVETLLNATTGLQDVTTDLEVAPGEFHLELKRDRLSKFGISAADVGRTLRTAVFGGNSLSITKDNEEIDIVVRIDFRDKNCVENIRTQLLERQEQITICRSYPTSVRDLETLRIATPQGTIPLIEVAQVQLQPAVTTIRHYDYERTVTVSASLAEGKVLAPMIAQLQSALNTAQLPESVAYSFGGENEDTNESLASLARASVIAFILIIAILLLQFGSFRQVAIILLTIPLAFMGVVYGLSILRFPFSFPGMIGITALAGIVVNDAIVLVDRFNTLKDQMPSIAEAVIAGCKQRLQPVILTTLTTATGVLPLIFSGEVFRDLAIVVAIGITVATLFTLVIIPVLYVLLEEDRNHTFFMVRWLKGIYGVLQRRFVRKKVQQESVIH